MSQLIYNNIQMDMIQTKEYRQEPVFDDNDTDLLYVRHRLSVVAIIGNAKFATQSDQVIKPAIQGESVVDTMKRISHALRAPRQPLKWSVNGEVLLEVEKGDDGVALDAHNGPKTRVISLNRLTEGAFLVEFAVEVCDSTCNGESSNRQYQTLRWSQTETFDERWYAILRTSGYLTVRSDLRTNPDSLRHLVTPKAPAGAWYRTKAQYSLSEDGLRLNFEFEDHQRHRLPPAAVGKVNGKFTIMSGDETGASLYAMVVIHMEGVPGMKTKQMLEMASKIAVARMDAAGANRSKSKNPNDPPGSIIASAAISEDLWDNTIDFMMRARIDNSSGERFNKIAINDNVFGAEIPYSEDEPTKGIAPELRGQVPLLSLTAAAFNDPCLQQAVTQITSVQKTLQPTSQAEPLDDEDANEDMIDDDAQAISAGDDEPDATAWIDSLSFTLTGGTPPAVVDEFSLIEDDLPGVWDFLMVVSRFETTENKFQLDSTKAGVPAAIIQIGNPRKRMICTWTASRFGAPPMIPPKTPADDNAEFIRGAVERENVKATLDGLTLKYTATGKYEYAFYDPSKVNEAYPIPPWLADAAPEVREDAEGEQILVWGDEIVPETSPIDPAPPLA